jgi:hypothetical protein
MDMPFPSSPVLVLAPFTPVAEGASPRFTELLDPDPEVALRDMAPTFWIPLRGGGGLQVRIQCYQDFQPGTILTRQAVESTPLDDLLSMVNLGPSATAEEEAMGRVLAREPAFKACESAWLGLKALVERLPEGTRVLLCPASEEGLEETLESLQRDLVLDPPRCILVDFMAMESPLVLGRLDSLARLGDALLSPVAAWAGPSFLGLESWAESSRLPYLKHLLEESRFAKWRTLRRQTRAQWVCLGCNRSRAGSVFISPVWLLGAMLVAPERSWKPAPMENVLSHGRVRDLGEIGLTFLPGVGPGRPVSLCGQPMSRPMTLSWIAGCLVRMRQDPGLRDWGEALEAYVQRTLTEGLRAVGQDPRGLMVRAEAREEGLLLHISFVLPEMQDVPSEPVELTFDWT